MRVLIVDSSTAVRSRLVLLLREAGITVVGQASAAAQVLSLVDSVSFEAIVLDPQLPDGSGLELLPILKARTPAPIIAIITNASRDAYRSRCLALGADHFFDKSRDFDTIAATLLGRT